MTIRVVVGEDNYITLEGISRILEQDDGVEVLAACKDLASLRAAIEASQPDVVLADIRMPPTKTDEGVKLAGELREAHPDMGVVILSEYAEPLYATELLEGGSDGRAYLLKDRVQDRAELGRALRAVAAGGSVIDARIVELLLAAHRQREDVNFEALSGREREILALIAGGWSNAAIADRLAITKRGVERHIHSIFWKLGLVDCEQLSRRVKATLLYLAGQVG